jgi:hypothetical protein
MTGLKLFIMALFGRLRHQCRNRDCMKTFYRPALEEWNEMGIDKEMYVCPHCGFNSYIVV